MYQPKDRLDRKIKGLRLLMLKVSQRRHEQRMNICISRSNRKNGDRKQMTKEECKSKASRALQHKIWKPGELNMSKTEQNDEMEDQL